MSGNFSDQPLEGRLLFVAAQVLHCANRSLSADIQRSIPGALAPALPRSDQGIRMNGKFPVRITSFEFFAQSGALKAVTLLAAQRNSLQLLVELNN
jgi:hypothetical protein